MCQWEQVVLHYYDNVLWVGGRRSFVPRSEGKWNENIIYKFFLSFFKISYFLVSFIVKLSHFEGAIYVYTIKFEKNTEC